MTARVLAALPKRLHPRAKQLMHAISYAEARAAAVEAVRVFSEELAALPKAAKKVTGELDQLLTFYDFPADHWKHLRTTNPIESPFSTVRLRTRVTKGAGCRQAVAMAFKLLEAAQERCRRDGYELMPLVRAGTTFMTGSSSSDPTNERRKRPRRSPKPPNGYPATTFDNCSFLRLCYRKPPQGAVTHAGADAPSRTALQRRRLALTAIRVPVLKARQTCTPPLTSMGPKRSYRCGEEGHTRIV